MIEEEASQNEEITKDEEELSEGEQAVKSGTVATTYTVVIGSLSTGYLTGDLTSTWSFINTIQILAFIPLMDSRQMSPLLK